MEISRTKGKTSRVCQNEFDLIVSALTISLWLSKNCSPYTVNLLACSCTTVKTFVITLVWSKTSATSRILFFVLSYDIFNKAVYFN